MIAEQCYFLHAQLRDARGNVARIVDIALLSPGPAEQTELFADRAIAKRLQRGLLRGVLQENQPSRVATACLGCLRCGSDPAFTGPAEFLRIVNDQRVSLRDGKQLLGERRLQYRQSGIEISQRCFVAGRQLRTRANEALVDERQRPQLVGTQP